MGFVLTTLAVTTNGIGGQDEPGTDNRADLRDTIPAVLRLQRLADDGGDAGPPLATPSPAPDGVSATPVLVSNAAEVEPVSGLPESAAPVEAELTGIEQAICQYGWECGIALRVFACESGPDYMAGFNGSGHAGTAQISPIHAWRFEERGLNFWEDALTLEWNLDVAYEIWTERWWYAWSCF